MEHDGYSPHMCHTCPLECQGRNMSSPGAFLYLLAAAASLAGFALVYAFNPAAARLFAWFPVFPILFPVCGELAARRLLRQFRRERIRRTYLGLACGLAFFLTCLAGAVFETLNNLFKPAFIM